MTTLRSCSHRTSSHLRLLRSSLIIRLLGCLAAACGPSCTGDAHVHMVPMDSRHIQRRPRYAHIAAQRCFWWVDGRGRIQVALAWQSPLPPHQTFILSFDLGKPPAGRARNYRIRRGRVLGLIRANPLSVRRLISYAGIVGLWREGPDTMVGSFRIWCRSQTLAIPAGWTDNSPQLLWGTFRAVRDRQRGEPLRREAETGLPASQPHAP